MRGRSLPRWTLGVLVPLIAASLPALAAAPSGSFTDDDDSVHEAAIESLAAGGVVRGCNPPANDHYCPEESLTRGQMAAVLRRALSLPEPPADFFTDDDESLFEADINAVAGRGITRGCNPPANDEFCPAANITREQMAAFLVRAFDLPPAAAGNPFRDDDDSAFEDEIESLAAAGITLGCDPPDNTRFCPTELLTRAEMATLLWRALSTREDATPPPPPPPPGAPPSPEGTPVVTIVDGRFHINGNVANPGAPAEGLLTNLRVVQGIFDDENPATRDAWAYPSGPGSGSWTADSVERNVSEFLAAMEAWAAAGLNALTLSLQGGNPNADDNGGGGPTSGTRMEVVSAFNADGSLKPAWAQRLVRVLDRAEELGMVVILNLFYRYQSDELAGRREVLAATESALDFVWGTHDYRHVIFDVANEVSPRTGPDNTYAHDILTMDHIHEVFAHMRSYAAARYPDRPLLVSSSVAAAFHPNMVPASFFESADFILWHGNGIDMATQEEYITAIRERTSKAIVWNEDNFSESGSCPERGIDAVAAKGDATVALGVSWGFHWKGCNDYRLGYQAMPVNYRNPSDPHQAEFLQWVGSVTG